MIFPDFAIGQPDQFRIIGKLKLDQHLGYSTGYSPDPSSSPVRFGTNLDLSMNSVSGMDEDNYDPFRKLAPAIGQKRAARQ